MNHPFSHPSCKNLFSLIQKVFKENIIYKKKNRYIIFLCGGKIEKYRRFLRYRRSLRYRFIKYAETNLKHFRIFIAEEATKDLLVDEKHEFINIAEFESVIANYTDCVLIFPESPGSISELSYFSTNSEIARKTLIVNDFKKQNDSFINLGPIDKISKQSIYGTPILINLKCPEFTYIKNRLDNNFSTIRAKRFRYEIFSELGYKEQLYVIFQLIYIFKAMTLEGLFFSIKVIFEDNNVEKINIKQILSFLIAGKYIKRVKEDDSYFTPTRGENPFLEFHNFDIIKLQIAVGSFFSMYHKDSYEVFRKM